VRRCYGCANRDADGSEDDLAACGVRRYIKAMNATRKIAKSSPTKPASKPERELAAHILSAPKGPRTLTHREIKKAVEKVFRERYGAHG